MSELALKMSKSFPFKFTDSRRSVVDDTRSFIKELIIVCLVGILTCLFYDLILNAFYLVGLFAAPHPVKFGAFQIGGICFLGPFLVRALIIARCYF